MGQIKEHPSRLSKELTEELLSLASKDDGYKTLIGKTMCTNDFYEGDVTKVIMMMIVMMMIITIIIISIVIIIIFILLLLLGGQQPGNWQGCL